MELFGNIVGHIGIACFLGSYFLLQNGRIVHTGMAYLGLNLVGAILLMISLVIDWNLSAFLLEATWALISIYGIYTHILKRRNP
jgi:hypothetical protein